MQSWTIHPIAERILNKNYTDLNEWDWDNLQDKLDEPLQYQEDPTAPRLPMIQLLSTQQDLPLLAKLVERGVNLNPPGPSLLLNAEDWLFYQALLFYGVPPVTNSRDQLILAYKHPQYPYRRYSTGRPNVEAKLPKRCLSAGYNLPVVYYPFLNTVNNGVTIYLFEPGTKNNLDLGHTFIAPSKFAAVNSLVQEMPESFERTSALERLDEFSLALQTTYPEIPLIDLLQMYNQLTNQVEETQNDPQMRYERPPGKYLHRLAGLDHLLDDTLIQLGKMQGYQTMIFQRQPEREVLTIVWDLRAKSSAYLCEAYLRPFPHDRIYHYYDDVYLNPEKLLLLEQTENEERRSTIQRRKIRSNARSLEEQQRDHQLRSRMTYYGVNRVEDLPPVRKYSRRNLVYQPRKRTSDQSDRSSEETSFNEDTD